MLGLGLFGVIGVLASVYVLVRAGRLAYETFFYRSDLSVYQTPTRDAWALVTGVTSGIGEGFAFELASRGWNVLLVSRSRDKLEKLQKEIAAQYPKAKTAIAVSDASASDSAKSVETVLTAAKALPSNSLRLLVNNVGVSNEEPTSFVANTPADVVNMCDVNCKYSSLLTLALLPLLRAATGGKVGSANKSSRQRAAIINLSSQSAFFHVPFLAVYSATKAFNLAFSNALRSELAEDGIEVLALTPGFVVSNMTKLKRASLNAPEARTTARGALDALGLKTHTGYVMHNLGLYLPLALLPTAVLDGLQLSFMKNFMVKKKASAERKAKAAAATAATGSAETKGQ